MDCMWPFKLWISFILFSEKKTPAYIIHKHTSMLLLKLLRSEKWNSWSKILRINKSLVWRLKIIEGFFTSLLNKFIYNGSTLQGMLQAILKQHNIVSFFLSRFTININYISVCQSRNGWIQHEIYL